MPCYCRVGIIIIKNTRFSMWSQLTCRWGRLLSHDRDKSLDSLLAFSDTLGRKVGKPQYSLARMAGFISWSVLVWVGVGPHFFLAEFGWTVKVFCIPRSFLILWLEIAGFRWRFFLLVPYDVFMSGFSSI